MQTTCKSMDLKRGIVMENLAKKIAEKKREPRVGVSDLSVCVQIVCQEKGTIGGDDESLASLGTVLLFLTGP